MKKTLKAALSLFGILLLIPAAALAKINEGNWEITTEMKTEGLPVNAPPRKGTSQECLSNKNFMPTPGAIGGHKDPDCVIKDQQFSGGKGSWKMHCEHVNGIKITDNDGEIVYKGDFFTGKILMKTTVKGNKGEEDTVLRSTLTISGKRLRGPCQK